MMTDVFQMGLAFTAGTVLGLGYFLTLWKTIERLPFVRQPTLWTTGTLILRLVVVLLGFYLVMGGQWERLVLCLLGFLLMRSLLIHRWGLTGMAKASIKN